MPLCRQCYNEKIKQQKLATHIIHSEDQSISTGLNDSGKSDKSENDDLIMDMEHLSMQNSSNDIKL